MVTIDADHLPTNSTPPPIVITSVSVDRKPAEPSDVIAIQPHQTVFEISYAGLTFVRPELTRFRYRLEGLENEWTEAGNRRTAYYSRVPYGRYRFVVIGANRDGIWNTTGASQTFDIVAPFYRTIWFETLALVAIIGMTFGLHRRRVAALRRETELRENFSRQLIDSQELERKRIAGELHDGLTQSLAVIKDWAQMGISDKSDPASNKRFMEISASASQALAEVREISHNLGPYQLDRLGLSETVREMLNRVASVSTIHFAADIADVDELLPKGSEINLYRIIQESVNNVTKHSAAVKCEVTLRHEPGRLHFSIQDDGKGFDRNAQAGRGLRRQGFGLVGMQERVRLLAATLTFDTAPGYGTRIDVDVPLETKST